MGHSRLLEMAPLVYRLRVFHSKYGPNLYHFRDKAS